MNMHGLWDSLTDRERAKWRGNLDPWAGPVDPDAHERWAARHRADVTSWQAKREQQADACGCWMRDCAECMAKISDGQRPAKGAVRRAALRCDAALQQAKELAARAVLP